MGEQRSCPEMVVILSAQRLALCAPSILNWQGAVGEFIMDL